MSPRTINECSAIHDDKLKQVTESMKEHFTTVINAHEGQERLMYSNVAEKIEALKVDLNSQITICHDRLIEKIINTHTLSDNNNKRLENVERKWLLAKGFGLAFAFLFAIGFFGPLLNKLI